MFVAFNGKMHSVTERANDIFTLEPSSPFNVFDFFPPQGAGVFPLQTGVYAAFVNINAFFIRNPLYLGRKFSAFLF
jgi:hypothetical protein